MIRFELNRQARNAIQTCISRDGQSNIVRADEIRVALAAADDFTGVSPG